MIRKIIHIDEKNAMAAVPVSLPAMRVPSAS